GVRRARARRGARRVAGLVPGSGRRGLRALGARAHTRGRARSDRTAGSGAMSDYPIERWRDTIAAAYDGGRALDDLAVRGAVEGTIAALDCGDLRVAEPQGGAWVTHGWIQQAIALYFRLRTSSTIEIGPF